MKTAEIKATLREKTGARHSALTRKQEKVPAVVYGESGVQHVEVDYREVSKLVHSPDLYLINLETGGEKRRVIIQDTQFHPLSDKIMHVDFMEAAVGKKANLSIPIHIIGSSVGVLNGGQLVVKMRRVKVSGIPAELPEFIEVDISNLEIGKSVKVGDLKGYEILDPANAVIVRVKTARAMEEVTPAAPAAGAEGAAEKAEAGDGAEGEEKEAGKEE